MNNPKVSIVIPVYNGSKYVSEAIDSALAQTYENLEIIVVNDGSRDNGETRRIALSYGDSIRYFEKENGGVSSALNLAIKEMRGDYFSWLSHDDRYYPNKIASQIAFLQDKVPNTILYSDYDLIDTDSHVFAFRTINHAETVLKPEFSVLRGYIDGISLLIPKQAFDEYGLFREDLRCTQDYEMWLRMMKTYHFVHQPEILASTRIHPAQDTKTSPFMLSEGNAFYIRAVDSFSADEKISLCGSEYNFYIEQKKFLDTTPYSEAAACMLERASTVKPGILKRCEETPVTVVIPCVSDGDALGLSLESLKVQTHLPAEILLVGHNIDLDIGLPLRRLLSDSNSIHELLDEGIHEASNDCISFLLPGDKYDPKTIELQLFRMLSTGCPVCCSSYESAGKRVTCSNDSWEIIRAAVSGRRIPMSTVMLQKSKLKHLKFECGLGQFNEQYFFLKLFSQKLPCGCTDAFCTVRDTATASFKRTDLYAYRKLMSLVFSEDNFFGMDKECAELCEKYCHLVSKCGSSSKEPFGKRILRYARSFFSNGPAYCIKRLINILHKS